MYIPDRNTRIKLRGISISKVTPDFGDFRYRKYGFTLTEKQEREAFIVRRETIGSGTISGTTGRKQ